MARFDDIILLFSSTSILLPITTCRSLDDKPLAKFLLHSQMESFQGLVGLLGLETRLASYPELRSSWSY